MKNKTFKKLIPTLEWLFGFNFLGTFIVIRDASRGSITVAFIFKLILALAVFDVIVIAGALAWIKWQENKKPL